MDQLSTRPQRLALAADAVVFVLLLLNWMIVAWSQSSLATVSRIPLLIALGFCALAWRRARLARAVAEESAEHERLRRQYKRNDLFDETDSAEKLAQASKHKTKKQSPARP